MNFVKTAVTFVRAFAPMCATRSFNDKVTYYPSMHANNPKQRRWLSPVVILFVGLFAVLALWTIAMSPRSSVVRVIPLTAKIEMEIERHWKFDIGYPMYVYTIRHRDNDLTDSGWFHTGDPLPPMKTIGNPWDRYIAFVQEDDPTRVLIVVDTEESNSWPAAMFDERWDDAKARHEEIMRGLRLQQENPRLRFDGE